MKKRISIIIATFFVLIAVLASFSACNVGYNVEYLTDGNGSIEGESVQHVKTGGRTTEVIAVPSDGYKFVEWSDGNTEAARSDVVGEENLTFTAKFEKCIYTINYYAGDGGTIEGETTQSVEYGGSGTTVTAVADEGYKFLFWSDTDSSDPVRRETDVKSDTVGMAIFQEIIEDEGGIITLRYETDGHGTIEGSAVQHIYPSRNGTAVKAIPDDGYEFDCWSDGVTTAERQDTLVNRTQTFTAQFKRIYVRYSVNYKLGEADSEISELIFYDNAFESMEFPVPTRERFTFGGWYIGDTRIADETGKMVIGKEMLDCEGTEIYAKWTANENYTYKILIVYVTEIDAQIPLRDGSGNMDVYYKMTEFDIEICKLITQQVKTYLDDMLDGLVTFEIDEYFTTVPVTTDSIISDSMGSFSFAWKIPELIISGILNEYQSVLSTFCFDDYEYLLHNAAGIAVKKYGTIFLESVYEGLLINNEPLDYLLDKSYWRWDYVIEPFMHELAHTIELQIDGAYEYHRVFSWFSNQGIYNSLTINKMYYLNQVEIDGEKVGIPIEFWKGEIETNLPEGW